MPLWNGQKVNNNMIDEQFDDDVKLRLTKECIMMMVLKDFGINVNITIAKYILEELFDELEKHEYIKKAND